MIKKIELSEIPGYRGIHGYGALQRELDEFMKSDWPACEVDTTAYGKPNYAGNAYHCAIKREHLGISVMRRGDRVFLIKESAK